VARSSSVSGGVTVVAAPGGGYTASSIKVTVQLADLASVDSVAGYNVTNRDRIVSRSLAVTQFPTATFSADPVAVPAALDSGQQVTLTVAGQLTVHGVTKSVAASLQLVASGGQVEVAGSISTNMQDFGVAPPQIGFTVVEPQVTIEFQLKLSQP
jgi:polyisoprenoid-binding protein YceI